jgi:hypothetical protein
MPFAAAMGGDRAAARRLSPRGLSDVAIGFSGTDNLELEGGPRSDASANGGEHGAPRNLRDLRRFGILGTYNLATVDTATSMPRFASS